MEGIVKESVCAAETETTFNGAFRHPRDCRMLKCLSGVLVVWCGVQQHVTAACFGDQILKAWQS